MDLSLFLLNIIQILLLEFAWLRPVFVTECHVFVSLQIVLSLVQKFPEFSSDSSISLIKLLVLSLQISHLILAELSDFLLF